MAVITRTYRKILAALLAALGFSGVAMSCGGYGGEVRAEYGTPSATFKAKGFVVSETDNSPIQGISATLGEKYPNDPEEQFYTIGTAHTDSSGNFNVEGRGYPRKEILYVELKDVDGKANGLFASKVVEADFSNVTFTGGSGHWNRGEAEINLGTIKMKPEDITETE